VHEFSCLCATIAVVLNLFLHCMALFHLSSTWSFIHSTHAIYYGSAAYPETNNVLIIVSGMEHHGYSSSWKSDRNLPSLKELGLLEVVLPHRKIFPSDPYPSPGPNRRYYFHHSCVALRRGRGSLRLP